MFNGHGCLRNTISGSESKHESVSSFSEVRAHYNCWESSSDVRQTAHFVFLFHINRTMTTNYRKDPPSIQLHDVCRGKCDLTFWGYSGCCFGDKFSKKQDLWRD